MGKMDEKNPIIRLVNKGMLMEKQNKAAYAQEFFVRAWNKASNDWEKCIAAHFVARHQSNPMDVLKWNIEALNLAKKVNSDEIKGYYPSLYLNIGTSYEDLCDFVKAEKYYNLAFETISDLPMNEDNKKYSDGVRKIILEKRNTFATVRKNGDRIKR